MWPRLVALIVIIIGYESTTEDGMLEFLLDFLKIIGYFDFEYYSFLLPQVSLVQFLLNVNLYLDSIIAIL